MSEQTAAPTAAELEKARDLWRELNGKLGHDGPLIARAFARQRACYAQIARGFVPVGADPIGPQHGAGRAVTAKGIAEAISRGCDVE